MDPVKKKDIIGKIIFIGCAIGAVLAIAFSVGPCVKKVKDNAEKRANTPVFSVKDIEIKINKWNAGGFGTVGIFDITLKNKSKFTAKDFVIEIEYFAKSGTKLGEASKTVYEILKPNETRRVRDLNVGFIPNDSEKCNVQVVSATPVQ